MEILVKSLNDNWCEKPMICPACKSVFIPSREDIDLYFNAGLMQTQRIVVCPVCWEHILLDIENIKRNEVKLWERELEKKTEN